MDKKINIGLIILTIGIALIFLLSVFNLKNASRTPEEPPKPEEPVTSEEDDTNKIYINVFFIECSIISHY